MKDLIDEYVRFNHFGVLVGMDFKLIAPGEVFYQMQIETQHLATPKHAHGGCISALADACMGVAALSLVASKNQVVSTLELKVSYFQAVAAKDKLTAHSQIKKAGNSIIFMEANISNQHGDLVAHSTGTFKAYAADKAGYTS